MTTRVVTECVSWRWHGNLGDDMIFAAQEAMFGKALDLGSYWEAPEAVLVGGGTFIPKALHHPDLVELSARLPTAFFGTGVGDPLFWGRDHIPDWLRALANARFIGVRGPLSQERLQSWGVPAGRLEWIGDPALYFTRKREAARAFGGKLAVNVGTTYGKLYGFDEETLLKEIIRALRQLHRSGWRITLVCAWEPDDVVIERVRQEVAVSGVEHWHDDYAVALESVQQFDVVLSEKLHVAVVAACRSVPFVALNYRSKVMDFCQSIGWNEFCIGTESLQAEELMGLIGALGQAPAAHAERLEARVLKVRKRLLQAASRTLSALT